MPARIAPYSAERNALERRRISGLLAQIRCPINRTMIKRTAIPSAPLYPGPPVEQTAGCTLAGADMVGGPLAAVEADRRIEPAELIAR